MPLPNVPSQNTIDNYDKEILKKLSETPNKIGSSIERFKFKDALIELMNLARLGNKYLADTEPWKLKSVDEKKTETVLNIALQIAASLAILCEPFMPFSSEKLKKILNLNNLSWNDAGSIIFKKGHKINQAIHLFEKIEDEKIDLQIKKLKQ